METTNKNILVPLDFSEQSIYALDLAIPFAKKIDAEIILLYVDQDKGMLSKFFSSETNDKFEEEVQKQMNDLAEMKMKSHAVKIRTWISRASSIHGKIVEYAEEHHSEMIVMGKGVMFSDAAEKNPMLGSNTSRVIRYSKCPVITTGRPVENHDCKKIMLPLDLTKETRQKVTWAIKLAKLFGSEIQVVSAFWSTSDIDIEQQLIHQLRQVESFISKQGIKCTANLVKESEDAKSLVPIMMKYIDEQKDIDLIMTMTQQEMNFTEYFLGSHASELIRKSNIPVMSIIPRDMGEIVIGL